MFRSTSNLRRRAARGLACLALPLLLALAACTDPEPWKGIVDDERKGDPNCDNLDQGQCIYPFPTDLYRAVENGRPELRFPEDTLPSRGNDVVDPSGYRRNGGYSAITPIYFTLEGATLEGTPPWDDIGRSLDKASRTLVLDAETGELQAHFAEIDVFSTMGDEPTPVIALRLARKLAYARRFIVAVHGLVGSDGKPLPATEGFAALRDRKPSTVAGVGKRREHFERNIFPAIEKAGIARADLQLAWDFTTDVEERTNGTLVAVRDAVFDVIGEDGPEYVIDAVEVDPSAEIARLIRGRARVPSFITGKSGEVQRLRLDDEGRPVAQGVEEVEFELQIPKSIWEGSEPGYVVQYGHGLLGSKNQARGGWFRQQANEQGFLIFGADMQGMSDGDLSIWLGVLTGNLSDLPYLSDKPHQGLVNHLALVRMLKGRFSRENDPRFTRAGGTPVYDPEKIRYYGNSQGGTMGGVMMSLQKDITRGVLGVPGGAYAFLLTRATLFVEGMGAPMIALYKDDMRDFIAVMGLAQLAFDRIDPINFEHRMTENPFPGTPSHTVLLHVAKEDAQVHNQISDIVARTVGASLMSPSVRNVWGLPPVSGTATGNVMVEWDFNIGNFGSGLVPMDLDVTHGCLRKLKEAQEQMDHFYRTGETRNTCHWGNGACFVPDDWNVPFCGGPRG